MQTYETLAVEHPHRATHTLLANERPDVLRPRSRPPGKPHTGPNFINARYNTEEHLHDSPPIIIGDDKGRTRPAHDGDYIGRPLTGSESRGSEEESSIHRVDDLGFEAAAALFSTIPRGTSDCDSVLSSPIEDIFRERKLNHVFRSQVSPKPVSFQHRLQRRIERALVCSAPDKQDYLPLDRFESIFDTRSIALLLQEACHLETDEELRDKFAKIVDFETGRSRRRILGVLVFMSRVNYIDNFIQEDIWDIHLPLERSASILNKRVRTRNSERALLLENWSRDEIELFFIYQKMFFVPFFDIKEHRLCSYDLGSDIRLPWKSFEHKTSGGFGAIHKVEIHSCHHNFARSNSGINSVFALKAIEAEDHKAYKEELSALEKTCARVQEEKHLIKLLLTFRHGDKFYLLFEWADGNLDEFWRTHSPGPRTSMRERWAAQQCLGLTRAVSRIHGLTTWQKRERSSSAGSLMEAERDWGRHGDIKPENILWFEEYGNDHNLLVMSDLGLTRYHSQFSKSIVPRSHIDGHSWAYRPPELDMDERISQKYDIWSLGCVFLEFCVWYLQGHEEVELFSFQRIDEDLPTYEGVEIEKFFNIEKTEDGHRESHVKSAVKERLRTLKGLSDQSTFAKGLLRIIEEKMLQCAPKQRATIDRIKADLWNILESIPKESNPQELSQDLAYIRRDDSAPSLGAPRDLSLYEVARELTIDDPETTTDDGSDTDLVMPTRSQRLRRENAEQSEDRRDAAPSKDGQGNFGILAADATAETRPKETNDRLPHVVLGPEDGEAPHGDAASSHITGGSPPTTKTNKTKKRHIRQKSKKWFQDQLMNLNRMWKG